MTKQNSSLSEIDLNKSFQTLIEHPFTAIQLVDKEKFHTGLFGFACKIIPNFFSKLIESEEGFQSAELTPIYEKESIDLIIKNESEIIAVFEMKLKTTVHNSGKTDISQCSSIKKKIDLLSKKQKFSKPPLFYLVTLFETKECKEDGWKNITYKKIAETLNENLPLVEKKIDKRHYALISLWLEYLNELVMISHCVSNAGLEAIDFKNLETSLDKIKLKGIFEDYRANLIINHSSISQFKAKEDFNLKTANTHGNGLLDLVLTKNDFDFGLQWQGNVLKLFAVPKIEKSKKGSTIRKKRDTFLSDLAEFYYKNQNVKFKFNRDGHFRSITIKDNWSFFSDLEIKIKELVEIMNFLKKFDPK
jgi:hypothetical protein